jgi:hypothetical protein
VAVNTAVSRSTRSTVLEHLRLLRGSLAVARDKLMHFRDDRVDRDTLEPAARRVDELMNMFATNLHDPALITLWSTEIRTAIAKVPNPKSADALHDASTELRARCALTVGPGRGLAAAPVRRMRRTRPGGARLCWPLAK